MEIYLWDNNIKGDISAQIFVSIFILSEDVDFEGTVQELEDDVWDFWDVNIYHVITTINTSVMSRSCWESTSLSWGQKFFAISNGLAELAKGTDKLFSCVFA